MRLRLLVIGLLLGGSVFLISGASAAQRSLVMSNTSFQTGTCAIHSGGGSLSLSVGDSVVWTNCDAIQHSVTWDNGTFAEQVVDPAATAQETFSSPGTFPYHCKFHPAQMTGTITVSAPATTTTTAKPTTTTVKPTTTLKATTTTVSTSTTTSTTETTIDLSSVFDESSTTSSSSSTTSTTKPNSGGGGGASTPVVVLLLLGIAGVGGGAVYAFRRMRQPL